MSKVLRFSAIALTVGAGALAALLFGVGSRPSATGPGPVLPQQAVDLAQGFEDLLARGIPPLTVSMADLLSERLADGALVPEQLRQGGLLHSPEPGMGAGGWSLLAIRLAPANQVEAHPSLALVSTSVSPRACALGGRAVARFHGELKNVFSSGAYVAGLLPTEAPVVGYALPVAVSGCARSSDGLWAYVHPLKLTEGL